MFREVTIALYGRKNDKNPVRVSRVDCNESTVAVNSEEQREKGGCRLQ